MRKLSYVPHHQHVTDNLTRYSPLLTHRTAYPVHQQRQCQSESREYCALERLGLPPHRWNVNTLRERLDRHLRCQPKLGRGVYIARQAIVLGDVTLGDQASVWFGAVLRGDINRIVIGPRSNIQDNAVIHLADDYPCLIGELVTVGHSAIVHAATVGNECLIGMGAVVLDGAVIGAQSIIGAKALVPPGMIVPEGSMVLGVPGKIVRTLSPEERAGLKLWATKNVENAAYCLEHNLNVGTPLPS